MRILFLIMLFIVLSLLSTAISSLLLQQENFAKRTQTLHLKSLNVWSNRNLAFPNQITSKALASSRALADPRFRSNPIGICTLLSTGNVDSSYSIVIENSIYYTLQKTCLAFRFINSRIDNNGNVYFTFLNDSASDRSNILLLLLLNPLYVEFSPITTKTTQGYRLTYVSYDATFSTTGNSNNFSYSPVYSSSFTAPIAQNGSNNDSDFDISYSSHVSIVNAQKSITLQFSPIVVSNAEMSCDPPFDYSKVSTPPLAATDIVNLSVINMSIFYLDEIASSFQKPSLTLAIPYDYSANVMVTTLVYMYDYDNDTSVRRTTPLTTVQKSFMNIIRILYANYIAPTFTLTFDININSSIFTRNNGTPVTFMELYVDNNITYQTCAYMNMTNGKNSFNILSVSAAPYATSTNYYYLVLSTSTNATLDCNINNNSPDTLTIMIPYNLTNQNTHIVLTISPEEKLFYASYFDSYKKTIVARSRNCVPPSTQHDICQGGKSCAATNDYATIFRNTSRSTGSTLGDTVLAYNKTYITSTENIKLGYVNMATT